MAAYSLFTELLPGDVANPNHQLLKIPLLLFLCQIPHRCQTSLRNTPDENHEECRNQEAFREMLGVPARTNLEPFPNWDVAEAFGAQAAGPLLSTTGPCGHQVALRASRR